MCTLWFHSLRSQCLLQLNDEVHMITQPGTDSYLCAISVSYVADKLVRDSGQTFSVHLSTSQCSVHYKVLVW